MSDQESVIQNSEFQDFEDLEPMNRLAFLHFNNFSTPTPTPTPATTTTTTTTTPSDNCTMCGGSMKRRSPSSSFLHDPSTTTYDSEPKPKRLMVEDDHSLRGFTKVSLPISSSIPIGPSVTSTNNSIPSSYPILRRCCSDLYNSPGTTNNVGAPSNQIPYSVLGSGSFLNPLSPDKTAKINVNATTPSPARGNSSAFPPLPPTFRRSVSELTPSAYETSVTAPGVGRTFTRSPSSGEMGGGVQVPGDSIKEESPNSKRLRRMKDRMREMSQWWDEVMHEGEDDGSEDNSSNTPKDASGIETDEVSVERVGECLIIHFKCPCGKGYQILLNGRNCYYKLM